MATGKDRFFYQAHNFLLFIYLKKNKMYYINWKSECGIETVDETKTLKDAKYLVEEYNMAFGGGCYISSECCKSWKE